MSDWYYEPVALFPRNRFDTHEAWLFVYRVDGDKGERTVEAFSSRTRKGMYREIREWIQRTKATEAYVFDATGNRWIT